MITHYQLEFFKTSTPWNNDVTPSLNENDSSDHNLSHCDIRLSVGEHESLNQKLRDHLVKTFGYTDTYLTIPQEGTITFNQYEEKDCTPIQNPETYTGAMYLCDYTVHIEQITIKTLPQEELLLLLPGSVA